MDIFEKKFKIETICSERAMQRIRRRMKVQRKEEHQIQKEKLVQFYFSQYRDSAMALKKKNNDGKKTYEQRIGRLITEMQRTKTGKLTQPHLEEYHRQIRNMAYYALKQKNQYAIMQIRDILMPELVRLDIGTLREEEQELVTSRLLE